MTDLMNETDLQELAERGAAELDGASAQELLRWTDENFGGNYIVASNMQDAVLVDLAAKVRPGVDVLFLDTGYHFVETIGTRDAVEAVYDINVRKTVSPSRTSCSARTCSPVSPTSAAGCARSSRWARRCADTRRG
jgi:phosphoadenosine phosphosulfate reductase